MSENRFEKYVQQPEAQNENRFSKYLQKEPQKQEEKGLLGHAQDAGVSLLKGVVAVPETLIGLSDIPSGGRTGKFLEEHTPIQFKQTKDILNDWHTDQYKEQQKQFNEAGQNEDSLLGKVVEKGKVALSNPSMITNTVVESAPSMVLGGAIGRGLGLASKAIKPIVAGVAGEGAVMAGQQAENIRYETDDKLLTPEQSGLSIATGALGSLFGYAGGQVARKLGFDDLETAMASGRFNSQLVGDSIQKLPLSSIPKSIIGGALTEGLVEELPQSVSEQLLQNIALDRPLDEGVDSAIVMGTLAGMAMGGGMNTVSAPLNYHQNNKTYSEQQNAVAQEQQRSIDENQAKEQQQLAKQQQRIFGFGKDQPTANYDADDIYAKTGIPPSPIIDESKFVSAPLNYENGVDYTQPQINTVQDQTGTTQQNIENSIEYTPQSQHENWSLNNENPQNYDNSIEFESQKPSDLESKVQFYDLYGQSTPDPQIDYSAVSPFTDTQQPIVNQQRLSEQLGINPNDGPMSSAAALAVDSGASPTAQLGYTPEQQTQEQSNTPISDVVPNDYRQLLGNHNEGQSFNTNFEDAAIQQGNAQSDNAGESISQQYDINTADEMAGEFEKNGTESAPQTKIIQPILGADGKNKWFGNQEKAQAFIDKKKLGNDYQVVQDGKRFEIQPNVAQVQDGNQSQLKALEQQFEEAKTVPEKARIRKEINALQQGDNQPSAIENNISMPKNTILDAQNNIDKTQTNIDKTQTNNVADPLAQLEQQFLDAKSVPQKAKLKKQIDQLKSQQTEITTTPFGSEQIQKQYGDTAESVMSDIEILGDDFTIDLRDDNKKTNALNNPNYNAVQKTDGSVEIVGMKHPSTGEWVGKKPNAISIDENAHQAATSSQNNTPEPTQAQIEAGNYKKGHIKVHGLDISIENPKGSERRGTDPNGKEWAHTMSDHYGYIKRTKGADNEHIDTYIGNNPDSNQVFIVDQIDQETGNFDEHKVMLGFDSQDNATKAYKSNFDKGWKVGPIRNMDMEQFKDWLKNEDTSKPAGESKNVSENVSENSGKTNLETNTNTQDTALGDAQNVSKNVSSNKPKDYSRKTPLKPDNERRGASPLDTTFTPLSVVSATRRVLSILQHLKMSATQDASSRERINVSLNNRIGVNKVGNVNSNGFIVQVISSFSDLPKVIQNDATYKDENGKTQNYDVSGVWHDGTLYVVADQVYGDSNKQLTTFDAYQELLTHEIVGHFGVQKLFGNEYKTKFQQLFNALGKLEGIRKIAKDNGVNMQQFESAYIEPYIQGVKDEIYTESDVQQALVGELFAFVAQNAEKKPFVRQKLKEVLGYIRQWFRERGFDKFLSHYNDADLMMFLSEARKAVVDQSYFGKYKNQEFSSKNNSDSPLYSRRTKSNSGSTTQQVRELLIDRFGKETIDELERQGKLEIIQDYQVEGVEGFYYNGKAVLVASNLTAESTVPTFLHELGGHAGFQNMMNQKQYNELMNQFNKLVEQGNPVALAAKMLAEREQGSERQQLEYLPYLLTLSSTMQQRNVIQRNALQKLINNIVSYVKAWVFDNFGINLNLNPDDMLALSERMIGQIKHQSSLDLIRQKYHGTNQWMTAPNGAKTHLSEQQWLQVRTPEFKKWFGDWENDAANASQVLDENGEPKVVYHGTASEFNEFKQGHGILGDGIYLTDSFDTADVYANIRGRNGFVLPLFVNIRNAFQTTAEVSRDEIVKATSTGKYQGVIHHFDDQEYIVALEPNQVKMAEGNTGTFNSESADIRFSRSDQGVADRLSENIKNLYKGNFKLPSMADAMKYGLMFLSRMQITDIYKKILPQLSVYNDLVHQMDADKNDIAAHADNIVREWAKLNKRIDKNDPNSKTEEEALAELMHEATLAQIDPAKPYQPGDDKVKYQQLHKAYNALSPEAQVMYKKARNAYSQHYAKVREAVRERILRSALSSERKADLLKKIEGSFGQIKGVYFPLARFGKYIVVSRNQNGDVESISRAETENEANALRAELIKKYPQLEVDSVIRDQEYNALRDKVGRGFMSDLFDEVGNLGLDAKKQAEFEDTLGQLYLSSMPDLSWAKHGMHRKGTAGFSNNARRAFAQNMSNGASYLAKLRYGDQLTAQLDEMKEYAKAQIKEDPSYKQPLASAVIDEMNARHENLMNAKGNAVSSLLTSMGFIYFLGLSPAAAMVNIMQTPLVAYPIMGAKFGFDKAGIALLKASTDYAKGVGFEMPDFTDLESFRNSLSDSIDPDIAKVLKEHEKQAYEKAVSAGVIDVTQAHDLAGIAQGEDSGVMWKMRPIMRAASLMFHHAERFNREVTFIAAYRLSKESGMADNDAYKQAVKMTYDGHFDYSASNRARFMQGNVAKVVFLFKQFGQNMIYTIARQSYIALIGKNHTKEERIEAARAISAMLVTHALAAGVLGLPMVTTLLAVASMFGGGDDDPWDAEVALRNGLADMTSPTFSNLVMKGLSRGTPADISGRVGLDSMFLAKTQDGLEGQKLYEQLIIGNLGATVGMGANIAKGIQELGQGNYARALEEMLPTFAKNPFKAYRYATEGVQDKTGVDILDGHPVSGAGIFSQTIGFSPSQVRTAYEGKSAIYQQQQALQKRKSKLTANWVRAKRNDDQEGMDSAWKDIQEFNEVNPKLRINRINLMQSYHKNVKRIRDAENGVYLSKKYRDIGDYGRFAETD